MSLKRFFNPEAWQKEQQEELERLDREYQKAMDGLILEYVRGDMIGWLNNFKRLQRLYGNKLEGYTDEEYAFYIKSLIIRCASFESQNEDKISVKTILADFEKTITEEIINNARKLGFNGDSLESAILVLAEARMLDPIIKCLEFYKGKVERKCSEKRPLGSRLL